MKELHQSTTGNEMNKHQIKSLFGLLTSLCLGLPEKFS